MENEKRERRSYRAWLLVSSFLIGMSIASGLIGLFAQEAISLTVPVTTPTMTGYTPSSLRIQLTPTPEIMVILASSTGVRESFYYPCATPCAMDTPAKVVTMINALNTANLATRSLWRRVMDRLLLDFPERFVGGAVVQ